MVQRNFDSMRRAKPPDYGGFPGRVPRTNFGFMTGAGGILVDRAVRPLAGGSPVVNSDGKGHISCSVADAGAATNSFIMPTATKPTRL